MGDRLNTFRWWLWRKLHSLDRMVFAWIVGSYSKGEPTMLSNPFDKGL